MDEATYCRSVCGAKCCYLHLREEPEPVRCPRLEDDNSCGVYAERYGEGMPDVVVIGYFRSGAFKDLKGAPAWRPFPCGRVVQIAKKGGLPPEVERQCCVLHPELLER